MPNLLLAQATLGVLQFLPKMPAARLFTDLVFQFGHTHPHPPTFGVPLPSVGPVLAAGCWSVLINGQPAARSGDLGIGVWCGGYFPIFEIKFGSSHVFIGGARAARMLMDPTLHCLPDFFSKGGGAMKGMTKAIAKEAAKEAGKAAVKSVAQGLLTTGGMAALTSIAKSETEGDSVAQAAADAAGAAASAIADALGSATQAAQMAADAAAAAMGALLGKDPGAGFSLGFIMMGSPNVLIGGFPMVGWSTILKGLGKLLKPLIRKIQLMLPEGKLRNALCAVTGHPVDVASGRMFSTKTDFEIEGRIPIRFERIYDTSATKRESSLGWGWTHRYDQHLWESKRYNCLILRNEENRQVRFDKLAIGQKQFQPLERVHLERTGETEYKLFDCKDGLYYKFSQTVEGDFRNERFALRLTEIFDRNGNRVTLKHDGAILTEISNGTDSFLTLHYDRIAEKQRLAEIRHHLGNGQNISLMKYGYDGDAELISAANRTYAAYTYKYENHLLVQETNRNGLSFYFEYEAAGQNSRCTKTWGDGDIYERNISYFPKQRITKVLDGLGGETIYHYNDLDLVTKIYNAEGGIFQYEYGASGEVTKEIDELNRVRTYAYDDNLNCTSVVQEDGAAKKVEFDGYCQPLAVTDEAGAKWRREYDEKGNLTATVNPLGARREYVHNNFGDIEIFRDSLGNETNLEWTIAGQIASVVRPRGGKISYSYNERYFLSEVTDESTALKFQYQYDDQGRVKRVAEVNGRRETISVRRYEYDDQDNLLLYTDALGNKTNYRYAGFDSLAEQTDALGFKRRFEYDTEERVTKIVNERGEDYLFEYDLTDRVTAETGFDGAKRIYKYNQANELTYQQDALKREMFYRRDAMGRVISRMSGSALTVNYEYDVCGRLIKTKNDDGEIALSYDATGQITAETQNGQTINYEYDSEGRRIARFLNGGNRIEYGFDAEDNLSLVKIGERAINIERDAVGRTTARQTANGLREKFDYDINGRLSGQNVALGAGGREIVKRGYEWDALGNIVRLSDSLRGERRYNYDAAERLTRVERIISGENIKLPETNAGRKSNSALPADKRIWQADDRAALEFGQTRETEEFQYDGDGNLLERKSNVRGSRKFKYGKGDKLEEQEKIRYIYDAVGNLIQKRQADGSSISYEYDADNQLIAVSTETRGRIEFKYDAFGRRILKINDQGKTGFIWDGDVLLSEQKDSQAVTEYVHEGFVPLAKIRNSQIETYHTDYLGTPKEISDEQGEIVWQGNYDEYGKVTAVKAETEQNIRFQGQYEDEETGLFYNRFRYYDADGGRYINQDPIGLQGNYNFYGYCTNPVDWFDPLGLDELVYQLLDTKGNVIYYGITEQTAAARGNQHIRGDANRDIAPKDFDKMQVIAKGLSHDDARSLEGALIRQRLAEKSGKYSPLDSVETQLSKSGLLNKNRGRDKERWVKDPLANVKRLDTPEDVELSKKKAKTC